jgi:hypothetical protein
MWVRNNNGEIVYLDENFYGSQKNFYEEYYKIVYNKVFKEVDYNNNLLNIIKGETE